MRSVMLYFGSFNPIHRGHMAIAEYVLERGLADELWFVVSPQNPLKLSSELIGEAHRLRMVEEAVSHSPFAARMKACDVEFSMPRPSYTIDTLEKLTKLYPGTKFSILAGSDIFAGFTRWKEWGRLIGEYDFYIYPRKGHSDEGLPVALKDKFITLHDAPYRDISSTEIRQRLLNGADTADMLPEGVEAYIKQHSLWTIG